MRILSVISSIAHAFAPDDIAKALPVVADTYNNLSTDLKAGNLIAAAGHTLAGAATEMNNTGVAVGWTGLLGAIAHFFLDLSASGASRSAT